MDNKKITIEELREMLYSSWYSKEHQKQYNSTYGNGKAKEDWSSRELIITQIFDNHRTCGTIYFSLSGSPPKGRALLLITEYLNDEKDFWFGDLLFIGRRNKIIKNVKIQFPKKEDKNILYNEHLKELKC
jgi:hypothetical protein